MTLFLSYIYRIGMICSLNIYLLVADEIENLIFTD